MGLRLKKVCYNVPLCENCQRQSCKAFIGLTNRAKMIGGRRPFVPEISGQSDRVLRFSRNSRDFQADYITVVEDRPIMSVKYCLPVPVFYFWRKL